MAATCCLRVYRPSSGAALVYAPAPQATCARVPGTFPSTSDLRTARNYNHISGAPTGDRRVDNRGTAGRVRQRRRRACGPRVALARSQTRLELAGDAAGARSVGGLRDRGAGAGCDSEWSDGDRRAEEAEPRGPGART